MVFLGKMLYKTYLKKNYLTFLVNKNVFYLECGYWLCISI